MRYPLARFAGAGALAAALFLGLAPTTPASAQDSGAALLGRHAELADKLAKNPYKRPLAIESTQSSESQRGEVWAEVGHPFADVRRSLSSAKAWCDILILHLNVKRCRIEGLTLGVAIGRKNEDTADNASKVDFAFRVADSGEKYLQVQMSAANGPLGTRDYRIALEAVPLDDKRTFLHMSYSYGYGVAARMAMQAYLSTIGADKVGFTVTGRGADGKPQLVGGIRGVVERNTMRYYLGIESYLAAPAPDQAPRRIKAWFDATEEFAQQLHELSESEYTQMKRRELAPQ